MTLYTINALTNIWFGLSWSYIIGSKSLEILKELSKKFFCCWGFNTIWPKPIYHTLFPAFVNRLLSRTQNWWSYIASCLNLFCVAKKYVLCSNRFYLYFFCIFLTQKGNWLEESVWHYDNIWTIKLWQKEQICSLFFQFVVCRPL